MLEIGLLDSKMHQFPQSLQAVSAVYSAKKFLKYHNNSSNREINTYLTELGLDSRYTKENVESCSICFNKLAGLLQNSKI